MIVPSITSFTCRARQRKREGGTVFLLMLSVEGVKQCSFRENSMLITFLEVRGLVDSFARWPDNELDTVRSDSSR